MWFGDWENDPENPNIYFSRSFIEYEGNRATLIHRKGSNSWLMNTFELKLTDEQRVSNDTSLPTHNLPTRQRQEVGAVDADNLTDIQQKINEYRTAIRSGSLKNSKLQNIQAQSIDEQAVILQVSPISIIEEQDLNLPTQGGFQAVKQWTSDLSGRL